MKPLPMFLAALLCGAIVPAAAQQPPKTDPVQAPAEKKPASTARLNLNSASAPELAKLPGISDAKARAIVKGRPYKSKEELVNKKILTAAEYEEVKGNLYAGR